jgi:gamma-D-glutamyl-L-lysine dipeptidyl-peptidase
MQYAVCAVPVAPVRNAPDHKAEMVSQLLFGECCTVHATAPDGFIKISIKADGYEGWCQVQQLNEISASLYAKDVTALAGEWVNEIILNGGVMRVPFGSTLTGLGDESIDGKQYSFNGKVWNSATANKTEKLIKQLAFTFLHTPYLWGGRSVFGIDCSGFTQLLYKCLHIALPRDAHQQAGVGTTVDFLQQARCGDLAFFDNANGDIIHTGILLNDHEIIHASGKVQVDHIDNNGIINRLSGLRTQQLRIIKRYF